jgi:ABC-type uncharacterized transport system substrate-binding protein
MHRVKRRDFIAPLGSTATLWPLAVWGQQPANMPVVALVKFEFIINLRAARSLGIDVSPALLARADEVIE